MGSSIHYFKADEREDMGLENTAEMNTIKNESCQEHPGAIGRSTLPMDFRGTVLIADDEEIVRMVLEEMLIRLGLDVMTAKDGKQALELFRKDPDRFDLVIFDMTMPYMSGDQLFLELRKLKPGVRAVLSSGFHDSSPVEEMRAKGLNGFLPKPYDIVEICQVLNNVFNLPSDPE